MKVRLTRGVILLTVLTLAVAGAVLYRSWDAQASTWQSGLLVNLGSTLVLFAPLLVVGRGIEARLDRVSKRQDQITTRQEETASDVARLTEEVEQTQADLRLTREELSRVVRERITAKKNRDSDLFSAVGEAPTQADVLNSLVRAQEIGIIPQRGCRVGFISDCYLRFRPQESTEVIQLTLERIDARELQGIEWDPESDASDISARVADMMQASGVYPGDRSFDAGKIFADLAALLSLGHDSTTRGAVSPIRHITQLCPPQWAVCDDGIYCTDQPYEIEAWRLHEADWLPHMSGKTWVNMSSFEEALMTGRALFDAGQLAVKPRPPKRPRPDDPPF